MSLHQIFFGKSWRNPLGFFVTFLFPVGSEFAFEGIPELGAGENIKDDELSAGEMGFFGKGDVFLNSFFGFTGEAEDEKALGLDADFVGKFNGVLDSIDSFEFMDVFKNLGISRFDAEGNVVTAAFFH